MSVCHAAQKPGSENHGDCTWGQSDRESGSVLKPGQLRPLSCF